MDKIEDTNCCEMLGIQNYLENYLDNCMHRMRSNAFAANVHIELPEHFECKHDLG